MSPSPAITVPMRGAFPDAAGGSGTFEGTLAITSFVREAEINIRLPEASSTPVDPPTGDVIEIGITATGNFHVDGRALASNDRRTLRRAIETVMEERGFGERRDIPVMIRGDAESDLQASATAMSVAGELGFTSINIATVTLSDSP